MKRLLVIAAVSMFMLAACADNSSTEPKTDTDTTVQDTVNHVQTEAEKRAQEIKDSTTLLDKKLADPNDPHTPDSL